HVDIRGFTIGPDASQPQYAAYKHAYQNFRQEVDWMAFIDGDEFLFPTTATDLSEVLADFMHEELSALAVYWACFGSSGYVREPEGLIIENYRHRAEFA